MWFVIVFMLFVYVWSQIVLGFMDYWHEWKRSRQCRKRPQN